MNRFVWLRENGRLVPQKPEAHDWPTCLDHLARLYPPPQPGTDVVDTRTDRFGRTAAKEKDSTPMKKPGT
jgi:hypothetical protein